MARELVEKAVADERRKAVEKGVSLDVADKAAHAARRALGDVNDSPHRLRVRVRSYYWTVVRRTLMRRHDSGHMTSRFVLDSVIADLASSGRDGESVWSEIERGWSDRVPHAILEEYRVRLCA